MNYIGSKYSLLNFIDYGITKISNYKNGKNCVFADLFAGTGVVGKHYKAKGFEVISNDIQYYSYVLNKHYIENIPPLNNGLLEELLLFVEFPQPVNKETAPTATIPNATAFFQFIILSSIYFS